MVHQPLRREASSWRGTVTSSWGREKNDYRAARKGGVMYKASIENKGDSKYYVTTRHAGFVLDTEGNGANPIDTLLASLCGCIGHYVRDYLVDQQIAHSGFS